MSKLFFYQFFIFFDFYISRYVLQNFIRIKFYFCFYFFFFGEINLYNCSINFDLIYLLLLISSNNRLSSKQSQVNLKSTQKNFIKQIMGKQSSVKVCSGHLNYEKLMFIMVWSFLISYLPVQSQKICDQILPIGKYFRLILFF